MNVSKKPIQLKFECSQDWNAMKVTSCGRFCNVCNKEVIDFTTKSKTEFNSLITGTADLCGRFKPEQLDPSIISPLSLNFHKKAVVLVSTVLLTFFTKSLQAQSIVNKIEVVVVSPAIPLAIPQPPKKAATPETPIVSASHTPFIKTKKRRYYWSKRFPFVVVHRNYTTLMGCPSF